MIESGAKVYVLDGTADISPDYDVSYVNMIDCSDFSMSLNKLTINCVNISTSRNRFNKKDKNQYIDCIIDYIKSLPNDYDTIFTYQKIESVLKKHFDIVNHFGNIKGKNEYRDKTNIIQVGLNRYSNLSYMLQASYNTLGKYKSKATVVVGKSKFNNVMYHSILADIEQNLYRTKIRNIDNTDIVTYTILFNTNQYKQLIDLLKNRYGSLGANINVIDTPLEIKLLKSKERKQETNAQKILNWLSTKTKGSVFHIKDMLYDLNLNQKQFQRIKNKNTAIKELFCSMKISKGKYRIN